MKQWKSLAGTFFFDSFHLDPKGTIAFEFSTDAGHRFTHIFTHEFPKLVNPDDLKPALFALGMASLPSYWKATLAPNIEIRAGKLNEEQTRFWVNLYTKGLGEFFYVNEIDFRGLIHLTSSKHAPEIISTRSHITNPRKILVPFGGGKDSLVTGEYLKGQNKKFSWFELQYSSFTKKLQEESGVTDSIRIGRDTEKNFAPIMELVKQGAPNGHVPISAIYSMSAVLAAKAHDYSDVVLSLERSASFGNVEYLGEIINHQYSKSYEFEAMAADYIRTYIDPSIRVFSLLRPLYEIQIIREFVKYPKYFSNFISCNRGLKSGSWCGDCAKCAFIFAGLSAFLNPLEVKKIFKMNLFENEHLISLYRDLAGVGAMKPFECVGTYDENMLALYLSSEQYRNAGISLPIVLKELPIERGKNLLSILSEHSNEHLIPPDYTVPI